MTDDAILSLVVMDGLGGGVPDSVVEAWTDVAASLDGGGEESES